MKYRCCGYGTTESTVVQDPVAGTDACIIYHLERIGLLGVHLYLSVSIEHISLEFSHHDFKIAKTPRTCCKCQ